MTLKAKWIWKRQNSYLSYNQTIVARNSVTLKAAKQAFVQITADSYYRLSINNCWINDGPCRSWPEHFQYDQIDVSDILRPGVNEIKIIARYFGVGDFHRVCKQAGLLFQLDVTMNSGSHCTIISDETWEIADAVSWVSNTPKISIQMEPFEYYDARMEDDLEFTKACVLYNAYNGPWKDLKPRDVMLLTKKPFAFHSFLGANIVCSEGVNYCLPATRLLFPDSIEANSKVCLACGMATILSVDVDSSFDFYTEGMDFSVDGQQNPHGNYELKAGCHLILAFVKADYSHIKEKTFRLVNSSEFELQNPLNKNKKNPWCFIRFDDFAFAKEDMIWPDFLEEEPDSPLALKKYKDLIEKLLQDVVDEKSFNKDVRCYAECLSAEEMFVDDPFWHFKERKIFSDGTSQVVDAESLLHDDQDCTVVTPSESGDIELIYDLGEQNCGYYHFDLVSDEGVQVDINEVEYIGHDGKVQHTDNNRNGLCYITHDGHNVYTSLKRRSGRYLFVTLRNQKSPVRIRHIQLIESTYPVNDAGDFCCSDSDMNKIWKISSRTLKLCMEDVFTDCPLYEQTLWVGDVRNESLFAYTAFGTSDIAKRSIILAEQSLGYFSMVGCQVPSSWNCIIPAWSFLWGISVWEYYWYTGNKGFLEEIWPSVIKNLKGAEQYINQQGLFSAFFWNLFDWAPIDQQQKTVLHNSMFFVGAIDAAIRCSEIIGNNTDSIWLNQLRHQLCQGINRWWDDDKKSYPDSIHIDGRASRSICQHTSILSVLYNIVEQANRADAIANITKPSSGMVRVGSPFAMMYLYEAMEKVGKEDEIIKSIKENYSPMIEAGATTVWETLAGARPMPDGPTRSHCHGWSAVPLYFFNRIILGIQEISAGGTVVQISPKLNGLTWAKGTSLTINGPVKVCWRVNKMVLEVNCSIPKGMQVNFVPNDTHKDMQVVKNITRLDK